MTLSFLVSCSPLPTAPQSRAPAPSPIRGAAEQAATAEPSVIAKLAAGVTPDSVSASYGSTLLGSVPELNLQLFGTPAGMTADDFVRRLAADSRVEYAETDLGVECAEARQSTIAFSEASGTWTDVVDQTALQRIGADEAHTAGEGQGVLVAILDTGIDLDHPALADAIDLPGIEPGNASQPGDDRPESVDTNGDGIVDGALGHGTHVAGIVHAVAPLARLLPVRVLDSDGVGDAFGVVRGLVMAVHRGAGIANLSLGLTQTSRALAEAVDYARAAGVMVVAAAGNSSSDVLDFPASYLPVVAVAGTDPTDHRASFSDYGTLVDVAAPSVGIVSTYWDGGFAVWSGTSMAAPFASGIAALIYGRVGAPSPVNLATAESVLRSGAQPLTSVDPDYGSLLGAGRVSAVGSMDVLLGSAAGTDPSLTPVLRSGH